MIKAPRGTVDILPDKTGQWQKLEQLIRTICANYDVKEIRTPIFEATELFARGVGDTTDVVTKEMYTFADRKERSLTLRPEGTAGVARSYVQNKMYNTPDKISKLFYMGPMFRYERPQNGRQRQFHQFGVEMLGYESPYLDVECMAMAVTVVKSIGLENVTLHINTLGDKESRENYSKALKEHFAAHLDTLCSDCQARFEKNPLRILDCKVDKDHVALKTAPKTIDYLTDAAKANFDKVCSLLDMLGIEYVIDTNLVRGLDYYTHTVFEVISDDPKLGAGATVGGGGHYDGLVEQIGGPAIPGVGFAFGMERLMIAMGDSEEDESLDIYIMPLGDEATDKAMEIATMLRGNGYSCTFDVMHRSMKAMFKTVDRVHAKYAVILGDSEIAEGVVNVKDINTRNQETVKVDELVDYFDKKEGLM